MKNSANHAPNLEVLQSDEYYTASRELQLASPANIFAILLNSLQNLSKWDFEHHGHRLHCNLQIFVCIICSIAQINTNPAHIPGHEIFQVHTCHLWQSCERQLHEPNIPITSGKTDIRRSQHPFREGIMGRSWALKEIYYSAAKSVTSRCRLSKRFHFASHIISVLATLYLLSVVACGHVLPRTSMTPKSTSKITSGAFVLPTDSFSPPGNHSNPLLSTSTVYCSPQPMELADL